MNGRRKDDDDVFAYMEKFILDTVGRNPSEIREIENNIDSLDRDSKDTTLATQLNDAMMIRNNLGLHKGEEKLNLDTTRLTVLGHTFENVTRKVVDEDGNEYDEIVDFAEFDKLSKEEQDEIMDTLLEQMIPYDSNKEPIFSDEIDDRYDELYEEFKPKGIFSGLRQIGAEFWQGLRYGQTREESRKITMVQSEIRNAMKDLSIAKANEDSKKSWELTPEQLQEQQDKQQEFAAKASKSARENIVKNGKNAKDAHKEAQKEFNKEQSKYDSGLQNEDEEIDLF